MNTLCYLVVDPFNWMWAGHGLLLLFLIPLMILACNLSDLYKRSVRLGQDNRVAARVRKQRNKRNGSAGKNTNGL